VQCSAGTAANASATCRCPCSRCCPERVRIAWPCVAIQLRRLLLLQLWHCKVERRLRMLGCLLPLLLLVPLLLPLLLLEQCSLCAHAY
jgi:hypothetical protein